MRRGAAVQLIGSDRGADCPLPAGVPSGLLPVLAVVRGQQVAAALARRRGLDPDNPTGLSKSHADPLDPLASRQASGQGTSGERWKLSSMASQRGAWAASRLR